MHGLQTMQEIAKNSELLDSIHELQSFQKLRFIDTQQKLYQDKHSNAALIFLSNQLYQFQDFNLIQSNFIEIIPKICNFMPKEAQTALTSLLHLKVISFELDFSIAQKLKHTKINQDTYANAYIAANNLILRQSQIEAIRSFSENMHYLTRIRGVSFLFFLYQKPAIKLGFNNLYTSMQSGFESFKKLKKKDEFIQTLIADENKVIHSYFTNSTANSQ